MTWCHEPDLDALIARVNKLAEQQAKDHRLAFEALQNVIALTNAVQVTRPAADDLLRDYDDAATAYRLACRLGHGQDEAFAKWNDAREALIDRLCAEAKEAA